MRITFCGADESVTGSRHLLTVNGRKVLLDCGLVQGHRKEANEQNANLLFDPAELDAVVISHAHIDHSGELPVLPRHGFKGVIYGTPATIDLLPLMLRDSGHIQEADSLSWNRHHKKEEWIQPLYTIMEAEQIDRFLQPIPYETPREIVPGLTVTFLDAGHILGSAIVVCDVVEEGVKKRLVFSGDLGRKNLPILRDPQRFGDTDTLLLESTYGDRLHDAYELVRSQLVEIIQKTVANGGKILIPSFALERTQEIIEILHELHDAGEIPPVPVVLDSPLASRLLEVFMKHTEDYDDEMKKKYTSNGGSPFAFANLRITTSAEESKALNASAMPMIVISASGMCESGRILHHLKNNLNDPRTTVLIVGFMADGTLGRRLKEGFSPVKVLGDYVEVKAKIVDLGAFSAHADYGEELEYLSDQTVRKAIYLVHGEPAAQASLRQKLLDAKAAPVVEAAKLGQTIEL